MGEVSLENLDEKGVQFSKKGRESTGRLKRICLRGKGVVLIKVPSEFRGLARENFPQGVDGRVGNC